MKRWVGRTLGYTGTAVGAAVSVASNVYHTLIPPKPDWLSDAGWRQQGLQTQTVEPFSVGFAAFWPVAALMAVEIIARVQWPLGRAWTAARFGAVGTVAIVAVVISYGHLYGLLRWNGESPLGYTIGPAAIDGLMLVSTLALLATARADESVESTQSLESPDPTESTPVGLLDSVESGQIDSLDSLHPTQSSRIEADSTESGPVDSVESGRPTGRSAAGGSTESTESSRIVPFRRRTVKPTESTKKSDRVEEYAGRIKSAAEDGTIDWQPNKAQIMRTLKIGKSYVDAAIALIQEEEWSPRQQQSQATGARAE